jgi:diacylglycerol kinase (ATP)
MEKPLSEKKRFSLVARKKSFAYAFRGLRILFKTQPNFWMHAFFATVTVFFGIMLHISRIEWMLIVFAIGLVVTAEAFNTAVEIDIDLTSPTYHPYARDTKDVAAAAVLLSTLTAVSIGLLIFIPKILVLLH